MEPPGSRPATREHPSEPAAHFHHVHGKTLYRITGEPDNRNREPMTFAALRGIIDR
jgi:hypothetical protein